ncbi:MAG: AAA family ATPase [Chloroflexi bacterium]|nr:AAA family ATPase [Chloroflexota bacterium]
MSTQPHPDAAPAPSVQLYLFGTAIIKRGDTPINLNIAKATALLGYLAATNAPQTRAQMYTLLWPDSVGEAASKNLRNMLWTIRKTCGTDPIDSEGDLLTLCSDVWVDVDAFSQLSAEAKSGSARHPEALRVEGFALYRGSFLQGISLHNMDEFEYWLGIEREHRRQQFFEFATNLIERWRQLKDWQGVVDTALPALHVDNLHETINCALIEAYARLGDRPKAIRQYNLLSDLMRQELNTVPSASTRAVYQAIVDGEIDTPARPLADVNGAPHQASLRESSEQITERTIQLAREIARDHMRAKQNANPVDNQDCVPVVGKNVKLVGRSAEFAALVRTFYAAQESMHTATIRGEFGIGKSRLAQEFIRWARAQRAVTLFAKAIDTQSVLPYQPLVFALRRLIQQVDRLDTILDAAWMAELSHLLPELREHNPVAHAPDSGTDQVQLFEAFVHLGARLLEHQRGSVLIVYVDDLQWADSATLTLLQYATQRWQALRLPVMLLFTLRSEQMPIAAEQAQTVAGWLATVERDLPYQHVTLNPLPRADTDVLIESLVTDDTDYMAAAKQMFSDWLYEETGGYPFYIVETLQELVGRGLVVESRRGTDDFGLSFAPLLTMNEADLEAALRDFMPARIREITRERLKRLDRETTEVLIAAAVLRHPFTFEQLQQIVDLPEVQALIALDGALRANLLAERFDSAALTTTYAFTHDKIRAVIYNDLSVARRRIYHRRALSVLEQSGASAAQIAYHADNAALPEIALGYWAVAGIDAAEAGGFTEAVAYFESARRILRARAQTTFSDEQIAALYTALIDAYLQTGGLAEAHSAYAELLRLAQETGSAALQQHAYETLGPRLQQL